MAGSDVEPNRSYMRNEIVASKMTIGTKLFLSFGAASVLTLAVSGLALNSIGNLGGNIDRLVNVNAKKQYLAGDINTVASDLIAWERGIVLRAYMKDTATMTKYRQGFQDSAVRLKKRCEEFAPLIETTEARRMIEEIQTSLDKIRTNHEEIWSLASSGQTKAAAGVLKDKVMPLVIQVHSIGEQLVTQQGGLMGKVGQQAEGTVSRARWMILVAFAFSLAVAAVVVFVVLQINKSLRQAVIELSEGAEQVASAASQVSTSSQSLAQGSSELAASLEETSSSSEEVSAMARKNAANSRSAVELVSQSQQKSTQTKQSLDETVAAMSEIKTQSDKISKIIKVIDDIAFQTNILALNAAVEAARAGTAGMGFAVVADEVRNLAQRCAQAAKDTASLIEESITKSGNGKMKVDQVAAAIRIITEDSLKVKTLVDEISVGSDEQARGIEQIGKAVTQMGQVTQTTAATSEESAAAAEELNAQSEVLKNIAARLTEMVGGVTLTTR